MVLFQIIILKKIIQHHLIKLLCHFSDDFRVLHVSEHLSAHSTYMRKHTVAAEFT